jgi:hypothetical protein
VANGEVLRAGAVWMAWQAWCARERLDPGTQKKFGSWMKKRFEHERNSNRPRYVNVTLRPPVIGSAEVPGPASVGAKNC